MTEWTTSSSRFVTTRPSEVVSRSYGKERDFLPAVHARVSTNTYYMQKSEQALTDEEVPDTRVVLKSHDISKI